LLLFEINHKMNPDILKKDDHNILIAIKVHIQSGLKKLQSLGRSDVSQ